MHPVADTKAARALGTVLRRVGFTEDGICSLLGDDAYSADRDDAVAERRLPRTKHAAAIKLLFLQQPLSAADAVSAFGSRGVEALGVTGLAQVGRRVLPRARILAVGDLLVAADGDTSYAGDDPPDYVAAYTPTSRLCDALTPRRRGVRALDVGTGSGAQALLAARHARAVVATDVNERALEYTRLNAALNGLANVECRLGSWFAPVEGEHFDLITCNAPFVVSPENRWAYRDSGLPADEASARLVRAAAAHLADGGFATLAVSWIAEDEDAPDEHPLEWLSGTGCDSWLLPVWGADPLGHAARWNDHLGDDGRAFGGALDVWTDYLERLGARWVTEGAVLLHRRAGRRHATRVDELDEDALDDAGGQIARAFTNRAALADVTAAQLLERRISIAMPLVVERELGPRAVAGARVQLLAGTCSDVETTDAAFELLSSLDGRTTLGAALGGAGLQLHRRAVSLVRELLELGALELRP